MPKKTTKKRNPILGLLLLLCLLVTIAAAITLVWWKNVNTPVNVNDQTKILIVIPKGSSSAGIAAILAEKGLIKNELAFRIIVNRNDLGSQLQAGSYRLSKSLTLSQIAESLTHGVEEGFWVTIPEGKRREEIAKILKDSFTQHGAPFSIAEFMDLTTEIEGYLFPDTYLLPTTATAEDAVKVMRNTFDKKIPDEVKIKANDLDLTFQEIIILASLVEREAKYEVDRPMIARVMLNRLDIGMALQIDATVQYAVGQARCKAKLGYDCDWWPIIHNTDYDSQYNTYQHPGLPPAPICNPGLAVIEAALNAQDHDYLYYLSEDSGKTHYSKTLEEHEAKIEKYLR
jgi:UPF0755 protein